MRKRIRILLCTLVLSLSACRKTAADPISSPLPAAIPDSSEAEAEAAPLSEKEEMPAPEVPFRSMADYQNWARETGYPDGVLVSCGVEGIAEDRFNTSKDDNGYASGRIVIGDSRCVELGIYQYRSGADAYAVFAVWGGHYADSSPYLPDEEFYRRTEECFRAQIETKQKCDLYFFATVNDFDFLTNSNAGYIAAAVRCCERLASMRHTWAGTVYAPKVTVIGIAGGARSGGVLRYSSEEFNRYEEDYNELLKNAVRESEILREAEWTSVPEILNNGIGFLEDGLHYDDPTLKRLAEFILAPSGE